MFSEEDIEKNIEGFSDTELKKFILRNGIKYKGSSYKSGIEPEKLKSILKEFVELVTESEQSFVEFITFIDFMSRFSNVFKFATMCHLASLNDPNNLKYIMMGTQKFMTKDHVYSMMRYETTRLKKIFKDDQIGIETFEERQNRIEKEYQKNRNGVHASHCCFIHGCKYGDNNCPVEKGKIKQKYICEQCQNDGIKSLDELEAMLVLGLKKCSECGHYYKIDEIAYKN